MARRGKHETPEELRRRAAKGADGIGRRAFITGTVAAAAGGVAAATLAGGGAPPQRDDGDLHSGPAYRETEHIRRFYDLSRF